jgi:hypothetical protein
MRNLAMLNRAGKLDGLRVPPDAAIPAEQVFREARSRLP